MPACPPISPRRLRSGHDARISPMPTTSSIYDFATELYETKRVSDATYDAAVARFGHTVVMNLVGLLGYYALVAMTLNTFGMRAEGQTDLPFAE